MELAVQTHKNAQLQLCVIKEKRGIKSLRSKRKKVKENSIQLLSKSWE